MDIGETLRECAYRIGQPGAWTQRSLRRIDGSGHESFCAIGMMLEVATDGQFYEDSKSYPEDMGKVCEAFDKVIPSGISIPTWNNNPKRTQEEVVSAFLKAAEVYEKEEVLV